jgi:acyl-CoA thioester hydrolase
MAAPKPTTFAVAMEVRDYECDLQGIVNNAVYLNYLEHARHAALRQVGLRFDQLAAAGVHLVVVRCEIDYKRPLRSGDAFTVNTRGVRVTAVRFGFLQEIIRGGGTVSGASARAGADAVGATPELMARARVICAAMNDAGRPMMPPEVLQPMLAVCGPDERSKG